jgi:hypothetical protein
MSRLSRRGYAQAEGRIRRSIALRREGLPGDYPGRNDDLLTMRATHQRLGQTPPESGLYAFWRRFFGRAA